MWSGAQRKASSSSSLCTIANRQCLNDCSRLSCPTARAVKDVALPVSDGVAVGLTGTLKINASTSCNSWTSRCLSATRETSLVGAICSEELIAVTVATVFLQTIRTGLASIASTPPLLDVTQCPRNGIKRCRSSDSYMYNSPATVVSSFSFPLPELRMAVQVSSSCSETPNESNHAVRASVPLSAGAPLSSCARYSCGRVICSYQAATWVFRIISVRTSTVVYPPWSITRRRILL